MLQAPSSEQRIRRVARWANSPPPTVRPVSPGSEGSTGGRRAATVEPGVGRWLQGGTVRRPRGNPPLKSCIPSRGVAPSPRCLAHILGRPIDELATEPGRRRLTRGSGNASCRTRTPLGESGRVETRIRARARENEDVRLLMSIPGVGFYLASRLSSYIGDARRFPDADHLASYFGIVPSERSSSSVKRVGRMSKDGPSQARMALSMMVDTVAMYDPRLKEHYTRSNPGRRIPLGSPSGRVLPRPPGPGPSVSPVGSGSLGLPHVRAPNQRGSSRAGNRLVRTRWVRERVLARNLVGRDRDRSPSSQPRSEPGGDCHLRRPHARDRDLPGAHRGGRYRPHPSDALGRRAASVRPPSDGHCRPSSAPPRRDDGGPHLHSISPFPLLAAEDPTELPPLADPESVGRPVGPSGEFSVGWRAVAGKMPPVMPGLRREVWGRSW